MRLEEGLIEWIRVLRKELKLVAVVSLPFNFSFFYLFFHSLKPGWN